MIGADKIRPIQESINFRLVNSLSQVRLRYDCAIGKSFHPPSIGLQGSRHLTLVARLPVDLAQSVGSSIRGIRDSNPQHYYYPSNTIHLTLLNFDAVPKSAVRSADFKESLDELMEDCSAIRLRAYGFGMSPQTLFLRLRPLDSSLWAIRKRLSEIVDRFSSGRKPLLQIGFKGIAFANVVRFVGPLDRAFLRKCVTLHQKDLGCLTFRQFELVETDKVLSDSGTKLIAEWAVVGGAPV